MTGRSSPKWVAEVDRNTQNESKNTANTVTSPISVIPVGAQRLQMPDGAWGRSNRTEERVAVRNEYFKGKQTIPPELKDMIDSNYIYIGMSSTAVLASWGIPKSINKDTGTWGVHEQWEYVYVSPKCPHEYGFCQTLVYIENGVLTSWQELGDAH